MLKPIILTSLYALVGFSGWSAYSFIGNKDTSIDTLTAFAKQANQQVTQPAQTENRPVYRYKDENNKWVYSDTPFESKNLSNYEHELAFLKSLHQEAMPTKNFKTASQNTVAIQHHIESEDKDKPRNLLQEAVKKWGTFNKPASTE